MIQRIDVLLWLPEHANQETDPRPSELHSSALIDFHSTNSTDLLLDLLLAVFYKDIYPFIMTFRACTSDMGTRQSVHEFFGCLVSLFIATRDLRDLGARNIVRW